MSNTTSSDDSFSSSDDEIVNKLRLSSESDSDSDRPENQTTAKQPTAKQTTAKQPEPKVVEKNEKKICSKCQKLFSKNYISRHLKICKSK